MIKINGVEYEINRETARIADVDHKYYSLVSELDDEYEDLKIAHEKDYNRLRNMERLIQEKDDAFIEESYKTFLRRTNIRQNRLNLEEGSVPSKNIEARLRLIQVFEFLVTKNDKDEVFDIDSKIPKLYDIAKDSVKVGKQKVITNNVK